MKVINLVKFNEEEKEIIDNFFNSIVRPVCDRVYSPMGCTPKDCPFWNICPSLSKEHGEWLENKINQGTWREEE